jgi:hypothetical protein
MQMVCGMLGGFCAIGKCDPLCVFLLIESLPTDCKFYPLVFITWSSSYEVSPLLLFNPCSLFFMDPSFCWEEIPLIGIFKENHLVNRIKIKTMNDKGLIWSLWNAWWIIPFLIRIGHYQA